MIRKVAVSAFSLTPDRAYKRVRLFVIAALVLSDTSINNNKPLVVRADQPVHCLRGQLYGVWNFHVSKEEENVNLFEVDEVCTHKLPNKL